MNESDILRGFIIGFSVAAPIGPNGLLCVRRTLLGGRAAGIAHGLGAATVHALYAAIGVLGLSVVTATLNQQQVWIRLIGGLWLCYLGVRTFRRRGGASGVHEADDLLRIYRLAVLFTLTNPLTLLSFAAVLTSIGDPGTPDERHVGWAMVAAGVLLGSSAWWCILSGVVDVLKHRIVAPSRLYWVNRVAGSVITALGLLSLVRLAR